MQYRPQYCTIVVRNTDGGGYLRQFRTLAEAKDAYASISDSGATVYLYQPPTRSLASFEAGSNVPDYNNGVTYGTGDQVKFQGKIYQLNNFIGAAGYTPASHPNQWTEVTSFTPPNTPPISSTGSEITENGVTRSPFSFTAQQNLVGATMTKIGCEIHPMTDADFNTVLCAVFPKYRYTLPDGSILSEELGEKNTNGCFYPAGFKLQFTEGKTDDVYLKTRIINSLDYGGMVYGPYYQVRVFLGYERWYDVADGNGSFISQPLVGVPTRRANNSIEWEYQQNGDVPYKASIESVNDWKNWEKLGEPIPNGNYLVTYKVSGDDRIHSGYWSVSLFGGGDRWKFTPSEPDQPPPPPCSILLRTFNPETSQVEDDCDPDIVYPFSVEENCEEPVTVVIESQTFILGTNKKKGMDNGYGDVVWGPCSGMIYIPYGTLIYQGSELKYFSDGQGSYYTETVNPDNPCTPSGTILSDDRTDITVDINGVNYTVGYSYERTVADGNCGTGLEVGSEYTPNGTLITEDTSNEYYSDGVGGYYSETKITGYEGDEDHITVVGVSVVSRTRTRPQYKDGTTGEWSEWNYTPNGTFYFSDESYNYYANGGGGYYTEPKQQECPSAGTQIGSDSGEYTVNVGCGNWVTGNWSSSTFADGNCGTYSNGSANYVGYGILLGNCNDYNYYSNGSGGYYQGEYTGGGNNCDSYGTWLNGSNSDITVNSPCGGSWIVGSSYYSVYADGNCGTYSESGNNYYSSDTFLGNCNDYNYYSDGNGSYRQGEFTGSYPSAGSPTGNTSSGTNYLEINGVQYENGTFIATEYHDGSGGYYLGNYQYSYTSYGHYFGSQSYYDWASMNDVYTYYYSDGTGGYYTSY